MIDEGTNYCGQCEAYARRIEHLEADNSGLKTVKESLQAEVAGLVGNCERWAAKVEKLEAVAKAADKLIYRQTNIYRPESKKGLLKAALDALNQSSESSPTESKSS